MARTAFGLVRIKPVISSPTLDAARAILPHWVIAVSLVSIPALTFIVCATLMYVSVRVAIFREPALLSSWPECARASYPARQAKPVIFLIGFGAMLTFLIDHQNPLLPISLGYIAAICFPAALAASAAIDHTFAAQLGQPALGWRARIIAIVTGWLVNPAALVLGVVLFAMPGALGWRAVAMSVIGFAAFTASYRFGTLPLLVRIGLATPASLRLSSAVDQASRQTGTRPSAVFEIDLPTANAFALLLPNQIVFTRRAVEVLDDEQLAAVARHELAHLAEPKRNKLIHFAGNLVFFLFAWSDVVYWQFGWAGVIWLAAGTFAISRGFRKWMRQLESRADVAGRHSEPQGGVYAAALERIYRASNMPAAVHGGTHGSLYDRMIAAGVAPQYPRPATPSRARLRASLAACALLLVAAAMGFDALSDSLSATRLPAENGIMWRLALGLGGARELAALAEIRERAGSPEQAATFYEAAAELDGESVVYPARLAATLSALGRCDDATDAWSQAEVNLKYCSCRRERGAISAARAAELAVNRCSPHRAL